MIFMHLLRWSYNFFPSVCTVWWPYNTNISWHCLSWLYPISPLSHAHLFNFFPVLIGWVSMPSYSSLLLHLLCSWTLLAYFSVQLLYSSVLWLLFGTFLSFLSLHWSFHYVHPFISVFGEHLYDYYLVYLSVKLLISVSLS